MIRSYLDAFQVPYTHTHTHIHLVTQ